MKTSSGALCPVCNRYIGPAAKCPYCSSDAVKSPLMRTIKVIAVFMATAGLFLLYLTAKHREPPLISISAITPVMNFAHIRIAGEVRKKPYIGRDNEYLSFRVFDGSGSLQVAAYRETAKALIEGDLLPNAGDFVEVRGNLSASASKAKLYLEVPRHLIIRPALKETEP